jgi:hypothetical protein
MFTYRLSRRPEFHFVTNPGAPFRQQPEFYLEYEKLLP